jgi:hypothetical protein
MPTIIMLLVPLLTGGFGLVRRVLETTGKPRRRDPNRLVARAVWLGLFGSQFDPWAVVASFEERWSGWREE